MKAPNKFHFYKNFEPEDYAAVINSCSCIIGNSSSGIREASFLGVPSVNIGSRQNNRERGDNSSRLTINSKKFIMQLNISLSMVGTIHQKCLALGMPAKESSM